MLEKVNNADDYLTELLRLIKLLDSDRNQNYINSDFEFAYRYAKEDLKDAKSEYDKYFAEFAEIKAKYDSSIAVLTDQLGKDQDELEKVRKKKTDLTNQVENLEDISRAMPNWCHTNDNVVEIGDSRLPPRDIEELS